MRSKLGDDLGEQLHAAIPFIPLTGFQAFQTAWENDCRAEYRYAQLVLALGRPGDSLLAFSTSGESKSVNYAADAASRLGLTVISFTGERDSTLARHSDISIQVPATETFLVQEQHLQVYHELALRLERSLFTAA